MKLIAFIQSVTRIDYGPWSDLNSIVVWSNCQCELCTPPPPIALGTVASSCTVIYCCSVPSCTQLHYLTECGKVSSHCWVVATGHYLVTLWPLLRYNLTACSVFGPGLVHGFNMWDWLRAVISHNKDFLDPVDVAPGVPAPRILHLSPPMYTVTLPHWMRAYLFLFPTLYVLVSLFNNPVHVCS